jgi:EF-P beta-lysylation protein EpmB
MAHMITGSAQYYQPVDWQSDYANAIKNPYELLDFLQLDTDSLPYQLSHENSFATRGPWAYAKLMQKSEPYDPLLRQVLPIVDEEIHLPDFRIDPVGDMQAEVIPGLLHKYQGRVLLVTTGACAVHCRYCFRRHFPYADSNPLKSELNRILDYIQSDLSINEVILSGGDPLSLSDQRLAGLVSRLESIPQLETLRIHTRLPVVLPSRVDQHLLKWLAASRLKSVMVLHCNHPHEIGAELIDACVQLRQAGVTLLNQSVLLKDVNDNTRALTGLSQSLFRAGILPYYLHMLDRVEGAAHFEVSEARALQLMDELRTGLPGYLVPRLVSEFAGEAYKHPIK